MGTRCDSVEFVQALSRPAMARPTLTAMGGAVLAATGYAVVGQFVDRQLARTLYAMLQLRQVRGEAKRDGQVPGASSFWGDSTLDALLLAVRPEVEAVAGGLLLPTYCYARLYVHGDALERHRDREACEVVASIHIGSRGLAPPPIRFAPDIEVHQRPGDAVVFLGSRLEHWRDPFQGTDFGQVFLNYVRAGGAYRHHAFDGRHQQFPSWMVEPTRQQHAGTVD